jgi:hypothetical protein
VLSYAIPSQTDEGILTEILKNRPPPTKHKRRRQTMTKQHLIYLWNAVAQWFSKMMISSITRYGMLSIAILVVVAGLSVLSMLALHLPVLHTLGASLQLFNKVPFGEPWPH